MKKIKNLTFADDRGLEMCVEVKNKSGIGLIARIPDFVLLSFRRPSI
ncbi:hypothetical protein [Capnocytophaga stomatis]|nr:hypothetical protein [Capnocytophaga stomatis]